MKIKFIYIILLLNNFIYAQYSYYKLSGSNLVETLVRSEALSWDSYIFDIKTSEDFSWVPSYLGSFIDSRFNEAIEKWKTAMNETTFSLYIYQNQSDGIEIFFTDETQYFSNPITECAMTTSCVANNQFVVSCTENEAQRTDPLLPGHPKVTKARIVFNGTDEFGDQILSGNHCDGVPTNRVSVTYVAMHELGHIFGMNHDGLNNNSIMWYEMSGGPYCYMIQHDVGWLRKLIDPNAATPLEINKLLNTQHSFFDYDPVVLLYSQKQTENKENDKENSEQNTLINSGEKLLNGTENKQEGVKK